MQTQDHSKAKPPARGCARIRVLVIVLVAGALASALAGTVSGQWVTGLTTGSVAAVLAWIGVERTLLRSLHRLAERSASARAGAARPAGGRAEPDEFARISLDIEALVAELQARDALIEDAESSIRSNESRYRDLFESNPHPMVVFDVETLEILAANDSAVRRYGFTRQQFLRMTIRHLLPGPVTEGVPDILARMAVDHERPTEDRHRRRDGVVFDVEVSSHRMRFANRAAALAMFADITIRKKAEAETRRRTAEISALYESAREQAASLSSSEIAAAVVRAAVERFGAQAAWLGHAEPDGTISLRAAYPDGAEAVSARWDNRPQGTGASAEAVRRHAPVVYPVDSTPFELHPWPSGRLAEMQSGLALPLISRNAVFGVLHVLDSAPDAFPPERADLLNSFALQAATALTNAELHQRLRETATWLERRVRERTADLEAANRELEAFSYSVSHDLRAPLRAIDGFSRLAISDAGDELPQEAKRYLQMIRCSVSEMNDLIAALLAFSRSTRQQMHRTQINMNDIIGAVIDATRRETQDRSIEFRVEELPPCQADPTLIKQVFANLISNAVKYTGRADPAIVEVSGWHDGDVPVYRVRDNGVGFDPARADRLFGVFQRLHRADEFPGNGVGLATVQRIVSRHGGRVWFEAEPGAGATFYFSVPGDADGGVVDGSPPAHAARPEPTSR